MKKNARGFYQYGKVVDERGVVIHTSESSVATRKRFWLWIDDSDSVYTGEALVGKEIGAHLSAGDIRKLIKLLEKTLSKHRLN